MRTFPDGTPSDRRHPQAPSIKLAADDWIYLKLPRPGAAYEALASSPNGVVLFRNLKDGSYHRWRTGEMTELKPDQSPWRLPALLDKGPVPDGPDLVSLKLNNYVVNASGGIGLAYVMKRQGSNVDWEDEYIHFWPPDSTAPRTIQGEFYLKDVEWDGGIYRTVKRHSRLLTAANDGFIFGEFSRIEPRPTDVPFDSFYRYPSTGAGLADASWFGSDFVLTVANDRGDHIGKRVGGNGATLSGVVGYANVTFAPVYISENGVVLGRNGLANFSPLGSAGAQVLYSLADGVMPLPTGGRVMTVDEQNRPNGFDLDGKPVVWDTKRDSSGVPLVPKQYELKPYVPMPMPAGWSSTHLIAPGTTKHQLGIMTSAGTNQTLPFFAIRGGLRVDANRDGEVAFDGSDFTSAATPFRFWLNDDIDRKHTFQDSAADSMATVSETEEDDIGPAEASQFSWRADYLDGRIESKRDLEDFSRLWIQTLGLNAAVKSGDLKLGLKWADTGGTNPAIQLYEPIEADGGLGYLTDDAVAANQLLQKRNAINLINTATGSAATQIGGTGTFVLPNSLFANLSDAQPKTFLLFEGCTAGKGQLKLVMLKLGGGGAYTEIGEGPSVWLDLKKMGDMYEHWSVGNASGGAPSAIAARIPSLTGSGSAFKYDNGGPSPEEQKYILFVHGWNMVQWEKERFAETAYKRLWWQGYKGRFGLFSWPTTNNFSGGAIQGLIDGTNYDRGEFSAWRSGAPLRQLMQTLNSAYSGKLYVFSHSMGGVVASEALRLQSDVNGGQIASVYVASQAALSVHSYDGTLSEATGSTDAVQWIYNHPSLPNGTQNYGPQTPNIYRNWTAYVLDGSAVSTKVVGTLVNFYNANDWALAAPAWHFNQITKPDYPDPSSPFTYEYNGTPDVFDDVFRKTPFTGSIIALHLGTRAVSEDRYEIMSFAAESRVKSLGASPTLSQGVTEPVNLRLLQGWSSDAGENKAHKWHSGQFRSTIIRQRDYWKTLLGGRGFDLSTTTLP